MPPWEEERGRKPPGLAAAPLVARVTSQLLTDSRGAGPEFEADARLPGRVWTEWLAIREPRLIGLKGKKCYFSSHKTTKRNGETKILFRLNKLPGDFSGALPET